MLKYQSKDLLEEAIKNNYNFLRFANGITFLKLVNLLTKLNTKFTNLIEPIGGDKDFLDFVYRNNYYIINENNIFLLLNIYGKGNEDIQGNFIRENYATILKSGCTPLIENIHSQINAYVSEIYLKNERLEPSDTLVTLINKEELSHDLKVETLRKTTTKIQKINDIIDPSLWAEILKENRLFPSWENVAGYYTNFDNVFDEILINFLNSSEVYLALSDEKMQNGHQLNDYPEFQTAFLINNDISDEAYIKIVDSINFKSNDLNISELSEQKVSVLVKRILNTSIENYDNLRSDFPNQHKSLLENDFKGVLDRPNEFETDGEDVLLLLTSLKISNKQKVEYISLKDQRWIIESKDVSSVVLKLLVEENAKIDLSINELIALMTSNSSEPQKVKCLLQHIDILEDTDIKEAVSAISESYNKLFESNKRPTLSNTEYNGRLLSLLKNKELIKSYSLEKKNKQLIRVIANN